MMTNDYPNFTYERKKPGDPIRSRDWNAAMQAIVNFGQALRNKTSGIPTGPLTIQGALNVQGTVTATTVTATRFVGDGSGLTGLPDAGNSQLVNAPANLQRVGQWTAQQGPVNGVYVAGKYAYLAVDNIGLAIVDISDPATPRQVGEGGYASLYTRSVQVAGRYAYLATSRMGLDIYDIANAAIPRQVGAVSLQATTQDIYVSGPYAYLATDDKGLQVIDISNPTVAKSMGQGAPTIGSGQGVYVVGQYAYVATSDQGLQIVNISDPANPQPIGVGLNAVGSAQGVYVVGQYAYVATSDQGLQIVDISDPAAPQRIGQGATAIGSAQGVYVAGDYAYVATSDKGLQIVNIAQPIDPKLQSIGDIGSTQAVFVAGRYAYIAAGAAGLQVIDIQGTAIFAASIGAVAANVLSVSENATVDNNLYVRSGLNVGPGGIMSDGTVTAMRFVGDGSGLTGLPGGSGGSQWVNKADETNGIYYSAGPVSIGATNKGATLQILNRNQDANGDTLILGRTDGSHVRLGYHADYGWLQSGGSKPLFINPLDGNVGIGTTQASEKLEVNGTVKATRFVGDGSGLIGLPATGSANLMKIDGNNTLEFGVGVSGKQVDAGKIGYQTFTPDALDIVGAGTTVTNRKIKLWAEGGATITGGLTISDNVGIGTTSPPGAKLEVAGGAIRPAAGNSETAGIMFPKDPGGGGSDAAWIRYYPREGEKTTFEIGTANDADDHIALMASGNVGIGTTSPQMSLHIRPPKNNQGIRLDEADANGNLTTRYFRIYYEGQGTIVFYHQDGAGQFMPPNGNWSRNSDLSLKEHITPLSGVLDNVLKLRPVNFTWKSNKSEDMGFVAQDVEHVFPQLVSPVNIEGKKLKGLAYTQFAVLAIAAIQEQQELIMNLRDEINNLRGHI
jgi:hypothetical protein